MKLRTPLATIFASQNPRAKKARWMVVDDNPDVLDSVTALLEALDRADVYKFRSGDEALNCFALYSDEFELVITDFSLAGLNGVELCRRMREMSSTTKIILSMGSALTAEKFANKIELNGVLPKPYTEDELWQAVKSILPEHVN